MTDNRLDNKTRQRRLAYAGMLAAFVFAGTEIHVSTAIGYVNLGDAVILIAAYLLGPFAFFPAAIGSALGDLMAGYAQYIIPTFIIKGAMGAIAGAILLSKEGKQIPIARRIIAAVLAEIIMVGGYFAFESLPFMYGPAAAAGSLIPNLIQAAAAIAIAIPITYVSGFQRIKNEF
ncbi:MAG: ECF transporter S component [Clostridiales bacterium]|nr:ECF transporter S component [Clostridiales bacterium]